MNKGHLEDIYESIQEKRKNRDEHIEIVTKLNNEIQKEILEYRIESTIRVLEDIHQLCLISNEELIKNIDNKIVHCLNKLSGNIDGIELELGDHE